MVKFIKNGKIIIIVKFEKLDDEYFLNCFIIDIGVGIKFEK